MVSSLGFLSAPNVSSTGCYNLQARPLPLGKRPGKGGLKVGNLFGNTHLIPVKQQQKNHTYYSFLIVSACQRGAGLSFYLLAPSLWKQIPCTNFSLAEWSRDHFFHSLLGRSRWKYSIFLTRWYWWTEWAAALPSPNQQNQAGLWFSHQIGVIGSIAELSPYPYMASMTLNEVV